MTQQRRAFDVAVIGGGPAGATAGRLLAEWGYRVAIVTRPAPDVPALVESLPPSVRKLFRLIGLGAPEERAGLAPYGGNTSWWGTEVPRVEPFGAGPAGYQADRGRFDRYLLELATRAGVTVLDGIVTRVEATGDEARLVAGAETIHAGFALDASGRAGVMARDGRRQHDPGFRTLALVGRWRQPGGFQLPDPSHTLVETFPRGWAWSVPAGAERRQVAVMLDRTAVRSSGGRSLEAIYLESLRETRAFAGLIAGATLDPPVWSREASMYSAVQYAGPSWLLLGDAASFVDPLASIGVRKAMTSAWRAAAVVNTCLRRPADAPAALGYFATRERAVHRECRTTAARFFAESATCYDEPFWRARADALEDRYEATAPDGVDDRQLVRDPAVVAAHEQLRASPAIRLRRAPDFRLTRQPEIVGREVVLEEAVAGGRLSSGLRYLQGVNLPALVDAAERHDQVPAVFGEYVRRAGPVGFGEFLGALAVLVATGLLLNQAET